MATTQSLIDRVRLELGDIAKSFVERLYPDGTTNRFQLSYNPLNGASVQVSVNGTDVTTTSTVEEATGVLVLAAVPAAGAVLLVNGTHYRYFKDSEISGFVSTAVLEHTAKRVDSLGRTITLENLPALEEYPVSLYATTLALYTLATDASFDIDISAPDGVMIPRAQRYRQLMDMIQTRKEQYRELCTQLGIGLFSIDVFSLRRISKTTNRYVPVYKPQEVDDKSVSQRVELSNPTYGDANVAWPTETSALTAHQDIAFSATTTFVGSYTGYEFIAQLLTQRGSAQVVRQFDLSVTSTAPTRTVTAIARTAGSGTTVVTTDGAHGFTVGQKVWIYDADTPVLYIAGAEKITEKAQTITAVSGTTFTFVDTITTVIALSALEIMVTRDGEWTYTATLALTRDETLRLPNRCWWQVERVDPITAEEIEIIGGDFFTRKSYTAIL